ncbi:TonB-dependent siderophore receptor [Variovorax paradoxus]|uniref:Ferrichrome-iron receptor n=1 Tax=Variovorax paradoxus TaxID=34073 RepID=A0A0H2M5M6_VARPD|nr:TonB-dependent siderophore receptor [Variovorax paradoxus]KLN57416.1 ferrichrome-iron receptor precursor [Variovorax paradoxus]
MSYNPRHFRRALVPTAVFLACAPAAWAQNTDPKALETVEITGAKQPYRNLTATGATKTDALIRDLPQSVRVLGADVLQDAGVTNLAQALDLSSGISRQSNLGGLWDSYAIRGFTGDPNFGSDYLVNGFNYSRGYNGVRDAINTNSVEVLKGPASALYGRGEPGGTVNITTKKPLFQPSRTVGLSAGSFGTYRATADLTGPINENVAYRLTAAYEKGDSFRDHTQSERTMISPSFIWRLSEDTTLSYELEMSQQKATFDRGVPFVRGRAAVPVSAFYGEPNDGLHTTKTVGNQLFLQHYINDDWSFQSGLSFRESSIEGVSTEARFLRSDNQTLARQRRTRDNNASDLSGRAEVLGKLRGLGVTHNVLFGVDAYRFHDRRLQYRTASAADIDIYNPVYGRAAAAMTLNTDQKEAQRAYGLYLQDQIDLTKEWKLLGGVRYDRYNQSLSNFRTKSLTEQSLSSVSPRIGLVYQPSKTVSFYATAAGSFRPNSGVSINATAFPAEKGKSYEAGVKLDSPDGKVSSTIALYSITKNNVLTPDPRDPNNYSVAVGEQKSKGLEFDVSGEIYPSYRLSAAYAFTDSKVTKDSSTGYSLQGRQVANVPRNSANVMLVKTFGVNGAPASIGAGIQYVGERQGAVAPASAAEEFKLPAYTTVKVISSYEPSKQWRVSLDIDNLFNRKFYVSSYSNVWVYPGTKRRITLTAQYKF